MDWLAAVVLARHCFLASASCALLSAYCFLPPASSFCLLPSVLCYLLTQRRGGEMADATDLKSVGSNPVRVRIPPSAPIRDRSRPLIALPFLSLSAGDLTGCLSQTEVNS